MNSFEACEWLIKKYAPLMLVVGDYNGPKKCNRLIGAFRPPIPLGTIAKIKRLMAAGLTIGGISRKCGVTWQTAWRHSQ